VTDSGLTRLLLVSGGSGAFGVTERVVWELATRLPPARFAVHVWLPPGEGLDELARWLENRGTAVTRIGEPGSRWQWRPWAALGSALRRQRPEILHVHTDASERHQGLPALARLAGVPHVIVSVHGLPDPRPWRTLRKADVVTTVCESAAETFIHEKHIPRARLRVVPHAADPADPVAEQPVAHRVRETLGAGRFRPLLICAARLEESKGHDVLLDALERLARRDHDFVVGLAGEGARRAILERRVVELGLAPRVRFLGEVEALGPVLLAADLVVLPSREEAMPLSLLEAMARARPIVATRVGGVPDVIEHGEHGLLVAPGDPVALADAIARLAQDSELAQRLGEQAAERVRSAFTWRHALERFETIYDELLGLAGFTPDSGRRRTGAGAGRG
jgi:glycosyltransferase involved in cell wall biosynthesis